MLRKFLLVRKDDVSGISGTGVVAEGVQFSTGRVALNWTTRLTSTAIYDKIADLLEIHGHEGRTTVMWVDDDDGSKIDEHAAALASREAYIKEQALYNQDTIVNFEKRWVSQFDIIEALQQDLAKKDGIPLERWIEQNAYIDNLEHELKAMGEALDNRDKEIVQFHERVKAMDETLKERNSEIVDLYRVKSTLDRKNTSQISSSRDLIGKLDAVNESILNKLNSRIAERDSSIAGLTSAKAEQDLRSKDLIEGLNGSVERLITEVGYLHEEMDRDHKRIRELSREIEVDDKLLASRTELLEAIPECPTHGSQCIPNALDWVNGVKLLKLDEIEGFDKNPCGCDVKFSNDRPCLCDDTSSSNDRPFTYTNSRGRTYILHGKTTKMKSGEEQTIYFFSKIEKEGALSSVPEEYEVNESKNGLPILRKIRS